MLRPRLNSLLMKVLILVKSVSLLTSFFCAISKLTPKRSAGPDGYSSEFVKAIASSIFRCLRI